LHVPRFNKQTRRLETREVEVFVGKDYVVTLHNGSLKPLIKLQQDLESSSSEQRFYLGKGTGYFLYEIISVLFAYCFPILDKISKNISSLEQDILNEEGDVVHDHLREILLLKRNIIRFRRIMLPMRSVIVALENLKSDLLPTKLNAYFDDALDQVERIWDLLTSYKELIEALQDTNRMLISNRTNNVIKVLTVISTLFLPPIFVASLYGMNVSLPGAQEPQAFLTLSLVIFGSAIVFALYLKFRKWL
jgi:magnesium transporter